MSGAHPITDTGSDHDIITNIIPGALARISISPVAFNQFFLQPINPAEIIPEK